MTTQNWGTHDEWASHRKAQYSETIKGLKQLLGTATDIISRLSYATKTDEKGTEWDDNYLIQSNYRAISFLKSSVLNFENGGPISTNDALSRMIIERILLVRYLSRNKYANSDWREFRDAKDNHTELGSKFDKKCLFKSDPTPGAFRRELAPYLLSSSMSDADAGVFCNLKEGEEFDLIIKGRSYTVAMQKGKLNLHNKDYKDFSIGFLWKQFLIEKRISKTWDEKRIIEEDDRFWKSIRFYNNIIHSGYQGLASDLENRPERNYIVLVNMLENLSNWYEALFPLFNRYLKNDIEINEQLDMIRTIINNKELQDSKAA